MGLDVRRRGRHLVRAARVLERERVTLTKRANPEAEARVRCDHRHLAEILDDVRAVRGPRAAHEQRDLGAAPPLLVGRLLMQLHARLILLYVDVETADRNGLRGPLRGAHVDGHAGALLGPDEGHLGAQTELAARLAHAVLGAREDAPEHVRNLLVLHATPIVAHGHAVVERVALAFAARPLGNALLAIIVARVRGARRRSRLPLALLLASLIILEQSLVAPLVRGETEHLVEIGAIELVDCDLDVGQLADRLARVERVLHELSYGRVQALARVVEAGDVLVLGEEFGGRLEAQHLAAGRRDAAAVLFWWHSSVEPGPVERDAGNRVHDKHAKQL